MGSTPIQHSVLNVKAVVAALNQEKALVGAFSVITNLRMELFEALIPRQTLGPSASEHLNISISDTKFRGMPHAQSTTVSDFSHSI